jgi:hypothetical protein
VRDHVNDEIGTRDRPSNRVRAVEVYQLEVRSLVGPAATA